MYKCNTNLKNKIASFFNQQNWFIQEEQTIVVWNKQVTVNHRQICRDKRKVRFLGEMGGIILNQSSLEKNKSSRLWQFFYWLQAMVSEPLLEQGGFSFS